MGKTFTNNIVTNETSIAIEQLLIGAETAVWDKTRLDISVPPVGFTALGAVDEEASVISVTRSKLELRTGIPQVLQYDAVTSLEGKISSVLLSNSNKKAKFALGAADPLNVSPNAIIAIASTAANAITTSVVTLMTPPTGNAIVKVGDEFVTSDTIANWSSSSNLGVVASLDATNPTTVIHMFPVLPVVPANTGHFGAKTLGSRLALGTSVLKRYHLLGVADFLDGSQLVHQFKKVSAFGEWIEEVKASQTGRIPISFDAFGTTTTDYNGGISELVVGERYLFSA